MAPQLQLNVMAQDPLTTSVPTLFANHLGISRAGTEVQFEFIALDLNVLATKINEQIATEGAQGVVEITGKTVAKIVVPLHMFVQLEAHLETMFSSIKKEYALREADTNEHRAAIS